MMELCPHDPADAIAGVAISELAATAAHPPPPTHTGRPGGLPGPGHPGTTRRRGARPTFADTDAIRAALDRRFQSRIIDRHRALGGRSPITASLHHATPLDTVTDTLRSTGGDPLARVLEREQLARSPTRSANSRPTSASSALPARRPGASRTVLRTPWLER